MKVIDLSGPGGNAFALLGLAKKLAKELDMNSDLVIKDMTSGDYEHLKTVFEGYFGDYVELR